MENDNPKMTEIELLKVNLAATEADLLEYKIRESKAVREAYVAQIDPDGKLQVMDNRTINLVKDLSKKRNELKSLLIAVGERLSIDINDYAWDDITGELKKLPTPEEIAKEIEAQKSNESA